MSDKNKNSLPLSKENGGVCGNSAKKTATLYMKVADSVLIVLSVQSIL